MKLHINQNKLGLILLFLIFPLLSLPFIFIEIYNQKRYAYTLLAIFMGLCAILFPPFADLYRHNLDYFDFQNLNMIGIISKQRPDFVLYTLSATFAQLGINFEIIRFIFIVVSYEILFSIFLDITLKNSSLLDNKKTYFLSFIIVFLAVPFFWIVNGLRFSFAAMLLISGIYKLFFLQKSSGWFLTALAGFTHFGIIPIIFFVLLCKFGLIRLKPKFSFIISAIFILFAVPIVTTVFSKISLGANFDAIKTLYIDQSQMIFTEKRSLFGQIANILERITLLPLLIFLYKMREKSNYNNFLFLLLIIISLSSPFMILFDRLTLIAIPLILISFLYLYTPTTRKKMLLMSLFICSLIANFSYLYGYRETLIYGRTYQILYKPAPLILFNNYDIHWINTNLNIDGEFK